MTTASQFIHEAQREVGYTEHPAGSNHQKFAGEVGHANGQPWCMTFQVALAKRVGLTLPYTGAYTPSAVAAFKKINAWYAEPRPGDFVFYDWPDNVNRVQHVGVVVAVTATTITTVEGNTASDDGGNQSNGGGVYQRVRARNNTIVGYGRPAYATLPPPPIPQPEEDDMLKIVKCREHPNDGEFLTNGIDSVRTLTQEALIHGRGLGYYPATTDDVPHSWLVWVDQVQDGHHDPSDV